MRLRILTAGRLKSGPEFELVETYRSRLAGALGGLGPLEVQEIDDRKDVRGPFEAALAKLKPGAKIVALDERGEDRTTRELAGMLARWRDGGAPEAAFLIGPADGLDAAIRARADHALAFGRPTWPHLLVRAMLAEQLYRAASLLAGHPYHRD